MNPRPPSSPYRPSPAFILLFVLFSLIGIAALGTFIAVLFRVRL